MFVNCSFLIPLLPLVSFAVVGLLVKPQQKRLAYLISILLTFCSFLVAIGAAFEYFNSPYKETGEAIVQNYWTWLTFSSGIYPDHPVPFSASIGVLLDPISLMLALLVCLVSLLTQIYSIGYLEGHPGYKRFYAYMSLFTCAMLGLVLSTNLLQLYVFWELVGLGSFLLIGFYYNRASAVSACKKAFIVTRFADLGFLIGILILSYHTKSFDFAALEQGAQTISPWVVNTACLLIAMGAFGKSAMFPLHIWLPDAMEGPTPVSALIHAATMVVAGVYLIARLFGLFLYAPDVLLFIAGVGAFTALFAAIIACTQNDIKRVLAFSTLSQIGYMMLALGVATKDIPQGFTASMFHMTTHAFFKALLFLGAGALIHAVHSNDVWKMGGLRKKMPITHITFLIGCLAIAALPPFLVSGFYSKEEILGALHMSHHPILLFVAILVAALTSFYMFRIYYLAFWGPAAAEADKAHDPPISMSAPLIILAALSIVGGWLPFHEHIFYAGAVQPEPAHVGWLILLSATGAGFLGWLLADSLYRKRSSLVPKFASAFGFFYRAAVRKFYIDEVYLFVTKRVLFEGVSKPLESFDHRMVDGNVDNVGFVTVKSGGLLRLLSSGRIHLHLVSVIVGAILLILLFWVWLV